MLDSVIDELVGCTDRELDDRVRELEVERRRIEARLAAALVVTETRRSYRADGHRRLFNYQRATLNGSRGDAVRWGQIARLIDTVPQVGDAWLAGHVGHAQVAELARLRANPRCGARLADHVGFLLEQAEHLPFDDFRLVCRRFETLADPDGSFVDVGTTHEGRRASIHQIDGGVELSASGGDPVATEELITIFARYQEAEFRRDCAARRERWGDDALDHPLPRTPRQRRFDALHAIFRDAAAAPPGSRRPTPVVDIVADAATFERWLQHLSLLPDAGIDGERLDTRLLQDADDLVGRHCETSSGIPIHPHHVVQAALAGHVRRTVVDARGVVVDRGRTRRLFTGPARDAAQLLVTTCTHPGCGRPAASCDIDHLVPHTDGGPTDQDNGAPRCNPHNLDKDRLGLTTRRHGNGRVYTQRPDGTLIIPAGTRPPPPPPPAARFERFVRAGYEVIYATPCAS